MAKRKVRRKSAKRSSASGKSMRPGGGGRFAKLSSSLQRKGYSKKRANAIAASIGRKKYGKKKMAKWSAAGRRRASQKRRR